MTKAEETSGSILFEEKQHFPKWLYILMLSPILVLVGVVLIAAQDSSRDMWMVLLIGVLIQSLIFLLFRNVQLEKVVTTNGIYLRWTPFQKKYRVIEKENIDAADLRGAPMKYGSGYAISYGRVHNMSDGKGMQLVLNSGKKIFLGTGETERFEKAIRELITSSKNQFR